MQEKVLYKIYQKLHTRHKAELEAVVGEILTKRFETYADDIEERSSVQPNSIVLVEDIKAIAEKHGVELEGKESGV